MPIAKGQGRARGSKVVADDVVPGPEVRGDLLDNEVSFDVSPKPDPAGESRNILVAMPPAKRAEVALESSKTEKQLREMVAKSSGIVSVVDNTGRDEAHRAAMSLKNARVTIKNTGKAAREDAQAFSAAVIAEEKRLIAITEAEEERVFALRDAYDEKVKREKEEAERLARERVAAIRSKIEAIAALPLALAGAGSDRLIEELQKLVAMQPTAEEFDAMLPDMLLMIETVGSALSALLDGARKREEAERQRIIDQEAERARLAAQAEENAKLAAELERKREEAEAAAKVQADELARQRADMDRERAELEALREAMKPKPAPEVSEPQGAHFTYVHVMTDSDHTPSIQWNTPIEQLEAVAITPPANMPGFAAMDEQEPDDSTTIAILREAVRSLRHTRSSEFVSAVVLETLEQIEGE